MNKIDLFLFVEGRNLQKKYFPHLIYAKEGKKSMKMLGWVEAVPLLLEILEEQQEKSAVGVPTQKMIQNRSVFDKRVIPSTKPI